MYGAKNKTTNFDANPIKSYLKTIRKNINKIKKR